jgi:hypothetical protein
MDLAMLVFFFFLASEVPGADRHQKKYVEIKFKSRHYLKSSQSSLKNVGVENSNWSNNMQGNNWGSSERVLSNGQFDIK